MKENKMVVLFGGFVVLMSLLFSAYCLYRSDMVSKEYDDRVAAYQAESDLKTVKEIDMEGFRSLLDSGNEGIVFLSRPSCKYCAIVSSQLHIFADGRLPIYYLNLEKYYQTDEYEDVKAELGITYVPTIRYYKGGEMVYNLNCPLDDAYFDATGDERVALYKKMVDKINSFIDGAAGLSEPINEETLSDTVIAMPATKSDAEGKID